MENKEAAPPPTPYYNQSLDLPDWNEGLKVLSPNLPRHTPARTPWKMGPPQRTPQAKKPNMRAPAMAASAQRLPYGPTPTNTPVHGAHSTPGMHYTPALSSFPNALTAEFWLTRAKAREDEGDILGALGVLENAIRRNARPFSPLTKAISRLQAAAGMQEPRAAAARPAPVKLWSSLRPNAADKEKKKTLRFAGKADEDIVAADDGQEQLADSVAGPEKLTQLQDSETQDTEKFKERTPHVRFSTPAPMETTRQPKSPMASRSSNAGSTPFHSSGSRQRMSDFSDDSDDASISESGSPTTVSRRLLEPVLLETIRNMNACKPSGDKEYFENEAEMDEQADGEGPAESHMSESECMGNMQRYLLESEVSPTSGAIKVPFEDVSSHSMHADVSTPHGMTASPLSETDDVDEGRACEGNFSFDSLVPAATATPDLNLQAIPGLRTRPAAPPHGNATPSVCINPLYASTNTPSTANSDALNTAAYTPAAPADPMFYATPVTVSASTAPLLSALAAKNLFSAAPAIEEEPEEAPAADDQLQTEVQNNDEAALQTPAAVITEDGIATFQSQPNEQSDVAHSDGTSATATPGQEPTEDAEESTTESEEITEGSGAAPGSPAAQFAPLSLQGFAAARRAFPRTPASAVRRSRLEADDAPTPIRNPLRVATPVRARPRVGMTEMRSLLQDPHAPSPAQAAAMGSRNALSPMRAAPKMRTGLGHAQLVTPKRRSARKPAAAAPQSTGKMLAAAGFAYTPNAALAGRLAAAADGRPVLGDAMDADLLASMDEVEDGEGTPVVLEASQLEELAAVMGAVSLTPSLEAACRSRSNTPEPPGITMDATVPSTRNLETEADNETTPNATLTAPQSSMRITRSALRRSQPADGRGVAEEGAESEQEGTPSFKEAPTPPQSARVTRSAAKARQHTPVPAASAEASKEAAGSGEVSSSKSSKQMSPTERSIRQGLRRSTRLA